MQKATVLLVEDDEIASEVIHNYLRHCGFSVTPVFTATDSVSYIKNNHYDILILDINLPDFNGYEVLKSIKNQASLPIIITSAYNDTQSKLLAFKYGASDFMVKPLDLAELEARIWIQLGKNSEIKTDETKKVFELDDGQIYFKQQALQLTNIEFEILSTLINQSNKVIQRTQLIELLSSLSSPRSLDNHIKNIRKKIAKICDKNTYLKTEYGVGYILYNENI